MTGQPRPPLWRVMNETAACAFTGDLHRPHAERIITAAEIRAAADWIEHSCGDFANLSTDPVGDVVTALRHEADRAEAGE